MADLFLELQDDIKRDRARELWKRYGNLLIGGSIAIVVATAAGVAWKGYAQSQAEGRTAALMQALDQEDEAAKLAALKQFPRDKAQGALAQLRAAGLSRQGGKDSEALSAYSALAKDDSIPEDIRMLARVLAAHVAAGLKQAVELPTIPERKEGDAPLAFAAHAQEADAWRLYGEGKTEQAQAMFRALSDNVNAPPALRARSAGAAAYLAPGAQAATTTEE